MTRSKRLQAMFAAVMLAGSLALSACSTTGGDDGDGDVEQVLKYSPGFFPVSLDVQQFPAEEAVQVAAQQVLETLVVIKDGEPAPALAKSWTNPDELTWVFTLESDVKFSDGTPFTAKDVKASLDRLIELEGPLAAVVSSITSVEATDDQTVTFTTSDPLGTLPSTLSLIFIGQADKIADDAYWQKPIGTGPFKVESFTPDDKIVMLRNDDYWGTKAELDRVEILNYPEVAARITALETGEVDAITSVPPDQIEGVKGIDGVTFETGDSYTYYFNWFNQNRKPFDNVKVRQAMWHAVNVEGLVKDLYGDGASVAQAPMTQQVFGSTALPPYSYDPTLAKKLLAEAGLPNGFKASIQWPRDGGPNIKALAQAMISDWAKIGVTIEPLEKERAQWLEDFGTLNWDMNLQTNTTGTGDADFTLARLYLCSAKRMGYCNETLDATLLKARASLDPEERKTLYAEASKIIWDDAVGIFPADLKGNYAIRSNIKGFELPVNGRPVFALVSKTSD